MYKKILLFCLLIVFIILLLIIFLSTQGFKTDKFNPLIKEKINQINSDINLDINDVFFNINIPKRKIIIKTKNSKLGIDENFIDLNNIVVTLELYDFLRRKYTISDINITTKSNSIKKISNFLNSYELNFPRFVLLNQIKEGNLKINLNIIPDKILKNKHIYIIDGNFSNGQINIFNKFKFSETNFDFTFSKNQLNLSNIDFTFKDNLYNSKKLNIKKVNKIFNIKGNLVSKKGKLPVKEINNLFNFEFLSNQKIVGKITSEFSFLFEKKLKNLNLETKIIFDKIYSKKSIQNLIYLNNGELNARYKNNQLILDIDSDYKFINKQYNNNTDDNKFKLRLNKLLNENAKVQININNEKNIIDIKEINKYLKNLNFTVKDKITFSSNNIIFFNLDQHNRVKKLKIDSQIDLHNASINLKSKRLKKYFPNFKKKLNIKNSKISLNYSKNKKILNATGMYSLNKNFDPFQIKIDQNNENLKFDTSVEMKNIFINISDINYKKNFGEFSKVNLIGKYNSNKEIRLDQVLYLDKTNHVQLNNLAISKNDKIQELDELNMEYKDKNLINQIKLYKKNQKYILDVNSYDGTKIINNLLKNKSQRSFLNNFQNLNEKIDIRIGKFYIDKFNYLSNLNGNIEIKNNKIIHGNLNALINNTNVFKLNIRTNKKKEKLTNIFINKPSAFIKKYKFIKGFKEGILEYESVNKNNISTSKLNIRDFKIKKVPILAKILTLADIQGIADILTGEGIRFNEFEMFYSTKGKTTKINEMYAIGPAISILMEGFIENDELTSLKGTLVPATTLNKTIAKIPLLGDILVGKKVGEGVFGVSFKIKGPPNNLKTTVNPIKTLTPRFITRTLENLKRN